VAAAIYCRISRDRTGAGLGVERQEQDCRALAERLGLPVEVVLVDNDLSAYSGKKRPDYERLLEGLRAGRYSAVIVWHPDRLHRSPAELERFIDVIVAARVQEDVVLQRARPPADRPRALR
jgi:site-specific DNA recombinase